MTDKAQGVRLWWLVPRGTNFGVRNSPIGNNSIHVIEHSAYQAAVAEAEHLKRQLADQQSGCCDCSMFKAAIERAEHFETLARRQVTELAAEKLRSGKLKQAAIVLLRNVIGDVEGHYMMMGKGYLAKERIEKLNAEYAWLLESDYEKGE